MTSQERKNALITLGESLKKISLDEINALFYLASVQNQWFTVGNLNTAWQGIIHLLEKENLEKWYISYQIPRSKSNPKTIGVVMAGNIPAVGFHDALCVLISGNILQVKLSADDAVLMKFFLSRLIELFPEFESQIVFSERMKGIDLLIATGNDNTARYFDYYFSKIPRIIRRNRTSLAILEGNESKEELHALGLDIFTYFGLGCRNVSKIFIPTGFNIDTFFEAMYEFHAVINHKKYYNNYEYQRAIYLMNQDAFLDNNFFILKESDTLFSPVSVLYYQYYNSVDDILDFINQNQEKIQCIVSKNLAGRHVGFGKAQFPTIFDYADNIDTLKFILDNS
jgi:hypothetical protein